MELNKKLVNFESMNENTKLTLAEALLYTKGLAGGYGGDFPLSIASKDSIYRVPATNKFYVCETAYDGNQISAPNSNFVELSVWKNHDRLNNLKTTYIQKNISDFINAIEPGTIIKLKEPITYDEIIGIYTGESDSYGSGINFIANNPATNNFFLVGHTFNGAYKLKIKTPTELEIIESNTLIRRIFKIIVKVI